MKHLQQRLSEIHVYFLPKTALVLVYDYYALSSTLAAKHFIWNDAGSYGMDEAELWSIVCQLTAALHTIHNSQLAARVIEPTKILITNKNR